jgi:hypothetical protein
MVRNLLLNKFINILSYLGFTVIIFINITFLLFEVVLKLLSYRYVS